MQPYSVSRPTGVRGQRGRGSVQKGKLANVPMDKCICSFYSNNNRVYLIDWLCELSKYPHPVFPRSQYKSETEVNYVISFLF